MARKCVHLGKALGAMVILIASFDYYVCVNKPALQRLFKQHVEQRCEWVFSKYVSSPWEYEWHKNINRFQDEVCSVTKHDEIKCDKWIQSLANGGFPMDIFPYFVFDNNCTNEVRLHFIEPLVGLTRHPYFCLHGEEFLVNKDYMLIYPLDTHQKNFYFDLGASTYTSGAGGSSQSWFVETAYPNTRWDGIYCWESSPMNAEQVWAEIPGHLKPVYHWYNTPVNPAFNHSDNALEYIAKVAKPEDWVVLKIDIDNSPVEMELLERILHDTQISSLIDELYFEHHVNVGPMLPYWGRNPLKLSDTYLLFHRLRNLVVHMLSVAGLNTHLAALLDDLTSDLASKKDTLHEMNSERTPLLEYVTLSKNSETRAAIRALDDNTAKLKAAQAVVNELQILISKSEAALKGVTVNSFRIDFDTKASRNSVLFYAIQTLVKTIDKMEVDLKDEKIKATSGMEAVAELEKAQAELAQLVKKSDQESRYPSSLDNHSGDTSDQGLSEMIRVANERVQTLREKIGM